ncbi:MAG: hypothetical protein M1834_002210 [Cirrosporium novae-zelandiae]|nr:MAG: hypothetical protein M1834_002210 [Cirrosporium novae-zelandiae]
MDESMTDTFAQRNTPVPLLPPQSPSTTDDASVSGTKEHKRSRSEAIRKKSTDSSYAESESGRRLSLHDKLLNKLLQQVIPPNGSDDDVLRSDQRSAPYLERPAFSLPLMTTNFRRFNARIGVVFVFQYRIIRLLNWHQPTHTLSFLSISTFVILSPHLLPAISLVAFLIFVMVPAFIHRHPPPPSSTSNSDPITMYYSLHGPALAPAATVKPVAETSKDFFRNMRDLQNSMGDFSMLHDEIVTRLSPPTNFANEALSSAVFLALTVLVFLVALSAHLILWRPLFLLGVWVPILLLHPSIKSLVSSSPVRGSLETHSSTLQSRFESFIAKDILPPDTAEIREVEIFELQRRRSLVPTDPNGDGEWEPWLFSSSPYDPLSPARIAGSRPRGARFFEDVQPPEGWAWEGKKWVVDLGSKEWVEERMISGVEVETAGGRWVSDLALVDEDLEVGLREEGKAKGKAKEKKKDWEEGMKGAVALGKWRRRRWVRAVRRVEIPDDGNGG